MTDQPIPLEWLSACNDILDIHVKRQRKEQRTTPDMITMFTAGGMDPELKPAHVAALLATAIQRLAYTDLETTVT